MDRCEKKKNSILLLVFLFITIIWGCGWIYGDISLQEREALLALYDKTNGKNWVKQVNWNSAPGTENTWHGITCDADNTTVLKIELPGNGLQGGVPLDLEALANLTTLNLGNNDFSGTIPGWLGSHKNLEELVLDNNRLEGTLPKELANLKNLKVLRLDGNRLTGEIPAELVRLLNLEDNRCDFKWNGLYSLDANVRDFLRRKQVGGDWDSTQTMPPTGIEVVETTENAIYIRWQPIPYSGGMGGYQVFYREEGRDYIDKGIAVRSDKTANQFTLEGLKKSTKYYFKIRAWTSSHGDNKNQIESSFSDEIPITTRGIIISGTITKKGGEGVAGVILEASNGGGKAETNKEGIYNLSVSPGWTGTITPSREGLKFFPPSRSYGSMVVENTSGNNYSTEPGKWIHGTVTYHENEVSDVLLKFTGDSGENYSPSTDANGNYNQEVSNGWSGTVTPFKDRHGFEPGERRYDNITSSLDGQNYEVRLTTISGQVKMYGGKGGGGVKLIFSNVEKEKFPYLKDNAITNDQGNYELGVLENWIGKVEPESYPKSRFLFQPHLKEIEKNDNVKNQDFKAWRNFKFFLQCNFNLMILSGKADYKHYTSAHIGLEFLIGYKFTRQYYLWGGVNFISKVLYSDDLCGVSFSAQPGYSFGVGFFDFFSKRKNPHSLWNFEVGIILLNYLDNNIQSMDWGGKVGFGFIYNFYDRWFISLKDEVLVLDSFVGVKLGIGLGYRF